MDLLDELKRKLNVTWLEDDGYLMEVIEKAKEYINGKCGVSFNYCITGQHRTLMLERCFYDFNNALKDFESNYRSELIELIVNAACMPKTASVFKRVDDDVCV